MVRWLHREDLANEAVQLLCALIETGGGGQNATELAELCSEIRDPETSDELFARLIALEPENISVRVIFGKSLLARGEIFRAFEVLDPISDSRLSSTARGIVERGQRAHAAMTELGNGEASVLSRAICVFSDRETRPVDPDNIAGISFYTGSLGAGGAERQLTQIASVLHHRKNAGRNIHGTRISGTVEVIVNTVDADRGKNFFAPALKASGVPLQVTSRMPVQNLTDIETGNKDLTAILSHLPRNVRFGLERLTAHFKRTAPDVAYFWQDGAVLNGALAALIAGVPRIAISLRGLPPNLRPSMMKPEYPDLYRALAQIPGISFSCNSRTAANAYADWLDLPASRFSVIYNAVERLAEDGSEEDLRRWNLFAAETEPSAFTLGGIFRFTPNKRAISWLENADAFLTHHPSARFVLVGNGEELALAQTRAAQLGIEDRVLFVGNSKVPGFWLSKMDALCLMSENEGLPNVVIEAQIAGKPVISTPAGGASETFIDGETGYLLSSAKEPSQSEFLAYANALFIDPNRRKQMGAAGRENARLKFDREAILSQTIRFFHGETVAGDREMGRDVKITTLPPRTDKTPFAKRVQAAYNIGANL